MSNAGLDNDGPNTWSKNEKQPRRDGFSPMMLSLEDSVFPRDNFETVSVSRFKTKTRTSTFDLGLDIVVMVITARLVKNIDIVRNVCIVTTRVSVLFNYLSVL